jgi:hypothetical protein
MENRNPQVTENRNPHIRGQKISKKEIYFLN